MTTLREAAARALEALEDWDSPVALPAMVALKAALIEPVEPVAAWENKYGMKEWEVHALRAGWMPAPPQRKPLTDEEIAELARQEQFLLVCDGLDELTEIARAVEAALKERNA